jgi:hypothetical protein
MYHVYHDKQRVTDTPVSYNYLVRNIFRHNVRLNWTKISSLNVGDDYQCDTFVIVKVG